MRHQPGVRRWATHKDHLASRWYRARVNTFARTLYLGTLPSSRLETCCAQPKACPSSSHASSAKTERRPAVSLPLLISLVAEAIKASSIEASITGAVQVVGASIVQIETM
jgi:hypothetical protein